MGLTTRVGPLSPRPPQTVNYTIEGPAHQLLMQPFTRRVRAVVDRHTVLDTRRGMLLYETGIYPRLYVPEADIDASYFEPTDHTTHCPFKGDATYRTLRVGDRVVENALWAYPEPIATAPWLAGYASLYWEAADAWYDEDDQVFRHLADPYHRVDIRNSSRHVQVLAGDVVVAETHAPLLLGETGIPDRFYLTTDEVKLPMESTTTSTHCPYKGDASYWTLRLPDGQELVDAVWSYLDPLPESLPIAGRVSFRHEGLQILVDGEPA